MSIEEKVRLSLEEVKAEKEKIVAQLNAVLGAEKALSRLLETEGEATKKKEVSK